MEYKISEVVAKTNVPKSTILYYIKEGLLPEAKKIKANVHKYNDEHIELIRYIKYMQESMGSSIEEIKLALEKKNDSFSGSYAMLAPLMSTLSGETGLQQYEKEEFIEHFDIDTKLFETLLKDGLISPTSPNCFTKKDAGILTLAEQFLEVGLDYSILKEYLHHAQALAKVEQKMQQQLCDVKTEQNFSLLWKIMFDTLFNAKEYIFNRSTYRVLLETLKEEIKSK
ncbi:MAG: MerR family transcriptional regulator [Sulfurimonas sp.]